MDQNKRIEDSKFNLQSDFFFVISRQLDLFTYTHVAELFFSFYILLLYQYFTKYPIFLLHDKSVQASLLGAIVGVSIVLCMKKVICGVVNVTRKLFFFFKEGYSVMHMLLCTHHRVSPSHWFGGRDGLACSLTSSTDCPVAGQDRIGQINQRGPIRVFANESNLFTIKICI